VSHGHQGQSLTTNRKNAESLSTIHDFIFYHVTPAVRGYLLNLDSVKSHQVQHISLPSNAIQARVNPYDYGRSIVKVRVATNGTPPTHFMVYVYVFTLFTYSELRHVVLGHQIAHFGVSGAKLLCRLLLSPPRISPHSDGDRCVGRASRSQVTLPSSYSIISSRHKQ
jgi:hypothetical protein